MFSAARNDGMIGRDAGRGRRAGVAAAMLLACCGALVGCQGHGSYTEAFRQESMDKMARMKSATTFDMAQQQFFAGDLDKALDSIEQAISLAPDVAKLHTLRGRILIEMGRLEAAAQALNDSIERDDSIADPHYYMGIVMERFTQMERASEFYAKAAELDPTNPQYVIAQAEMLIALERLNDAWALLDTSRGTFRHNAGVRQTLGHIAMMQGEIERAIELFDEACLLAPEEPALVEDLARAQIAGGRFAEAENSLARLLARESSADRRDLEHLRASCLLRLGRPVEAREIYRRLSRDDRGSADFAAWMGLAKVSVTLDEPLQLRAAANRMIAIAPSRHEGHLMLALFQRETGNIEGAVASLSRARQRTQSDPEPALLQAVLLQRLGRESEALAAAQDAVRIAPDRADAKLVLEAVRSGATGATAVASEPIEP
jgi:tetratricopeptide (TPR) repeat protein